MTARTLMALTALSGASWGSNTADVDGGLLAGGQNWGNSSPTNPNIRASILKGTRAILLSSGGVVRMKDLVLVMGVDLAIAIALTTEMNNAFIQSQYALDFIKGESDVNYEWGIPAKYAGVRIVIEDAVQNTAGVNLDPSMGLALGSTTAYLLCRPEGGEVVEGPDDEPYEDKDAPPVVSTLACFAYEDMSVELFDEPKHRRVEADVVSDVQYQITSNASAFKFTKCLGV